MCVCERDRERIMKAKKVRNESDNVPILFTESHNRDERILTV